MFKISQSDSYTWPVTVDMPANGGTTERQSFDATFKRLPQTRIKEIFLAVAALEKSMNSPQDETAETKLAITDLEIAREVLIGWKGITDDKGEEVPFSEGARDKLLDIMLVTGSVVKAYFSSLQGAKRKN